jgi:hypothetical protein
MGKNEDAGGIQQGALNRKPSQQGPRTQSRQAKIAQTPNPDRDEGPIHDPDKVRRHDTTGKDRLFEDREQHDDAEQASEQTRLSRDRDRHGHE